MGDATMNYIASPQNNYLYNGKELQPEMDLDNYDFGARHYDPTLGRWTAVDPLAEQYEDFSTYNFVENNPVNLVDPDGMGIGGGPEYLPAWIPNWRGKFFRAFSCSGHGFRNIHHCRSGIWRLA